MNAEAFWRVLRTLSDGNPDGAESAIGHAKPSVVRSAFELAEANGLFYAMATRWLAQGHVIPPEVESLWRAVLEQREQFCRTIEALNEASAASGRDYIVIKDCRAIENVPRDVDIFVPEEGQAQFLQALIQEGFGYSYRDEGELSLSKKDCLRVDVYGRIHYLRRDFLTPEYLRSSRVAVRTHGVEHPALTSDAAILLNSVHSVLGHSGLTLLDFLDFRTLRAETVDAEKARAAAKAFGWVRMLDRWEAHLDRLEETIFRHTQAVQFPVRNGRKLVLGCVGALGSDPLSSREWRALSVSLFWDDLVFVSESSGIAKAIRGWGVVARASNAAGHHIRMLRGDRKGTREAGGVRDSP